MNWKKLNVDFPGSGDFLQRLRSDGVVRHPDAELIPLTDGVSSDIYCVRDGDDTFVVKRALPRLRVKEEWNADIGRNRYERMYIEYASKFLPQAMPQLRPGDARCGYFAMEYLGREFRSWKKILLAGDAQIAHAMQAATVLGKIHAHSAGDPEAEHQFNGVHLFMQLRIEPYLLTTGRQHPDLQTLFEAEAERLIASRVCLVHGDFSPKNMMISDSRLVLLDCEVAWYGDPAFDLAFLLTHLFLKALYHAPLQVGLEAMTNAFWGRYVGEAGSVIDPGVLEPRVVRLLLMLLLARIDGKSPVEYLGDPEKREKVRHFVHTELVKRNAKLETISSLWFNQLKA